jgi:RHS repeat-associated protein
VLQDSGPFSVYLHNGEFYLRDVDLEIPGRGFNYQFVRSYRNGVTFNGPLGYNWEFNYNRRLVIMGASVLRMDGFNRADEYTLNPDGSFKAPTGFYTSLVRTSDGGFVEREPGGTMIFYSAPDARGVAVMTHVTDRNGNTMRFVYNAQNQLIRVIDTLGRPIEYRYNDQGRLIEVSDFIGRTIRFEYDGNADLVAVTSPAVTGTPTHNDFPQGKTTRYSYSSGFDDETLNHNLLSITAPNEVASGGPARIRVEYDTRPNSPSRDRVLRQTIGGTAAPAEFNNGQIRFRNDARVPAGGTISYEYRFLGTASEDDFITPVSQTTVTDRNGNRTEYQFNQLGNIVRIREFTNRDIRPSDPEFFETRYEYNQDGKLLRAILPQGNSVEYAYDDRNPDRYQQGNLLTTTSRPDSARGGDQAAIRVTRTYEPIYNQIRTVTEARGNDPSFRPQNGGATSADRYTTVYIYDYQEGTDFAGLARQLGVSEDEVRRRLQGVPMGLGDVNGDGRTDQIAGNVVKVIRPTVNLLTDSRMSQVEGGTRQPIEVTFVYNSFGQLLARRDPEGNVTIYTYYPENDPDGDGRDLTPGLGSEPRGYLREVILDAVSSSERNSQTNPPPAEIHHSFFYDRVGNVIQEIDGRGIATRYAINQLNQVVQIIRAADVTEALRNPEEPNYGGCSDQTLIECRAGMVAFQYLTNLFYDFNNNLIRSEVENRDSNNQSLVGAFVESTFAYDILNDMVEETHEVNSTGSASDRAVTTRYRYDRNQNLVLVMSPAAVSGQQPSNVVSAVFDERDLLFTVTRGGVTDQFGGLAAHADIPERTTIPRSRDISTSSRFYDPNRNLTQLIDSADNTGDGQPEATTYLYDGFDRRVSVIDAVGNQSFANYDPASNVVRVSNFGPVGGPTPTSNRAATFTQPLTLQSIRQPLLSQVEFKYDELGRLFERDDRLFVYNGVTYMRSPHLTDGPLGSANDGVVVTRYEYDRNSRRTFVIEDDLSTSETLYDGVNRVIEQIDPEENRVQFVYDDDNNVVKMIQTDVTSRGAMTAGNMPDLTETFISINVYDSLNRLIRTTDNLGNTRRYQYDSRGNMIFQTDAQYSLDPADLIPDPLGLFPDPQSAIRNRQSAINRPGNAMAYFYDGLNRLLSEVSDGHVDGQGKNPIDRSNPANPDGLVVMDYQWDANSRLVAMADDGSSANDQNTSIGVIEPSNPRGNVTRFRYDDLNRLKQEVFDDGSIRDYTYDADDNLVRLIDENGSTMLHIYDGINRLVRRDITRATSSTPHPAGGRKDPNVNWAVIGTTVQAFEYDGLSRLTRSFDNNEPDTPDDDATVTFAYDSLSRRLEEVQNGQAVSSRWMGDNNRVGLVYPNGRELDMIYDRLDRIARISDQRPIVDYDYIGPARILERRYQNGVRLTHLNDAGRADTGYDAMQRELQRRHLRADNVLVAGFEYSYDSEHHKLAERALPANTQEAYAYDSIHRLTRAARQGQAPDTFQLDGANNWARRGNAANQPNNMNEYARFGNATLSYDDNGNLLDDGTYRYEYDVANRLKRITRKSGNAVVAVYAYDAQGRRIARTVTNSGELNEQVRYFYDGWAELEERRGTAVQQFVYSERLDDPLVLDRDQNGDGQTDERFFYHDDGRGHIVALTDERGQVVERVSYDAYGRPTWMDPSGRPLNVRSSPAGNPFLFTGRRFDPEAKLYYYRARSYHPTLGRFMQRDPMGMLGLEEMSYGNPYTYVGNNPITWRDPLGLSHLVARPGEFSPLQRPSMRRGVISPGPAVQRNLPAVQLPAVQRISDLGNQSALIALIARGGKPPNPSSGPKPMMGQGGPCPGSQNLGANPGLLTSLALGAISQLYRTCDDVYYWTFVKCLGVSLSEVDLFNCTFNKDPDCVKCHAVAWKAYLDCTRINIPPPLL